MRSFNTEDGIANETKMWPYVIYIMYMFVPVPVHVHHWPTMFHGYTVISQFINSLTSLVPSLRHTALEPGPHHAAQSTAHANQHYIHLLVNAEWECREYVSKETEPSREEQCGTTVSEILIFFFFLVQGFNRTWNISLFHTCVAPKLIIRLFLCLLLHYAKTHFDKTFKKEQTPKQWLIFLYSSWLIFPHSSFTVRASVSFSLVSNCKCTDWPVGILMPAVYSGE